ncbi:MAG: zinc ribbon domain-containing protein [Opitutales bacterium]
MIDPEVQNLLTLQARELKRDEINKELQAIPVKIKEVESEKQAARDRFDEAKQTLRSLEAQRKTLENEIAGSEAQITKYKNQQLSVKKNEEYQALTHEIETTQGKISDLETEELEVMEQIDVEAEKLKAIEGTFDDEIAALDTQISQAKEAEKALKEELTEAEARYEDALGPVSQKFLRAYNQAKVNLKNRPPYVAPIEGGVCKRSHLKVSNELISEAKTHGTPHFCDVTGCVVYID